MNQHAELVHDDIRGRRCSVIETELGGGLHWSSAGGRRLSALADGFQ
jgi:hypothetical protein